MHIGIDLGTTYCCVAYIDDEGKASIIPSSDNAETTPSVIWFDSKQAFVGKKANDRKIMPSSPIYEFVKRDIGKPHISRYEVNGFYYGPVGMSAIILRKLKKEAFSFFRKKGMIDASIEEKNFPLRCVITVPAYFGDKQRQDTMLAGYAAGLEVMAVINEPTAAALAYGKSLNEDKKIMVFDLGGGTFDVTILEMKDGKGQVVASDGADQLGGKDWDELIQNYLYSEFTRKTGKSIPDELGWEIQQKALQAKFELTEQELTSVVISDEGEDIEISLHRSDSRPRDDYSMMSMDDDVEFYFEERASSLLSICRSICTRMIEKAGLQWGDIHDIILAGGSCRMPMIPKMLEELTGRKISRIVPGFSYDTAIAFGAAIYGRHGAAIVRDVTSKTIGIKLSSNGTFYIEPLIEKNKKLPLKYKRSFKADANATLNVYEGESPQPDLCVFRGKLELNNPEGDVDVIMDIDEDGVLLTSVEFPPAQRKELRIMTEEAEIDKIELKNKVHTIDVRL